MKKTVISLFLLTLMLSSAVAQGFEHVGVAPQFDPVTMFGGDPSRVGRGVLAGTDIDQDGLYETWLTSYDHRVYCFEQTGTGDFALVWVSAENEADGSNPRDIEMGDLDNDGYPEIMFFIGEQLNDTDTFEGLQIYEWDGTDNGYGDAPDFVVNFFGAFNQPLAMSRVENFSVGDIDGDGVQEVLVANNGNTTGAFETKDGSPKFSEDRFIIFSITGDIGAGFGTQAVEEYAVSPRDGLGGGSPQDIIILDTDGDGMMEAACVSWNELGIFFIEATGANSYGNGLGKQVTTDFPFQNLTHDISIDDWTLRLCKADLDGDGKDEVYVVGYGAGKMYGVFDTDGNPLNIDPSEIIEIVDGVSHGCAACPSRKSIFVGLNNEVTKVTLDGNVSKPNSNTSIMGTWTSTTHEITDATSGSILKISDPFDSDNDGNPEFVLPFLGMVDLNVAGDDFDYDKNRVFRVVEWNDTYVEVQDYNVILPDDYKLEQNYPNPFNPTTNISYTLPMQINISVNIYNFLGEHVVTLLNNEIQQAGVHDVVWNSLNKNGARVPSGTYFYELKYGNFSKTKRMTLLK